MICVINKFQTIRNVICKYLLRKSALTFNCSAPQFWIAAYTYNGKSINCGE